MLLLAMKCLYSTQYKCYLHATFFCLNLGPIKINIRGNLFGKNSLKSRLMETLIGLWTCTADTYAKRVTLLLFTPGVDEQSGALFNSKDLVILTLVGLINSHSRTFMSYVYGRARGVGSTDRCLSMSFSQARQLVLSSAMSDDSIVSYLVLFDPSRPNCDCSQSSAASHLLFDA